MRLARLTALLSLIVSFALPAAAEPLAKQLFGAHALAHLRVGDHTGGLIAVDPPVRAWHDVVVLRPLAGLPPQSRSNS